MTKMHVRNITGLPAVLDKFDDFARQTVVRAMAEAGITVVAGSFEKGAVVTSSNEGVIRLAQSFNDVTATTELAETVTFIKSAWEVSLPNRAATAVYKAESVNTLEN